MESSGVLDLSTERNRSQLQDSQCRGNVDNVQHLLKETKEFEEKIQLYIGDDPLELRYNFILWIEQNYPNRGLDNGLIKILEDTLSLLKDDPKYNQDARYVALLIKYIDLQPNALETYKFVYKQGRGTECAILYHAWANQCEKVKDFKMANEVYQLGISNKAEPLEELKQVHLQFQLSVGRLTLGIGDVAPNTPYREALKKLHINSQPTQKSQLKDQKTETVSELRLPPKFQTGCSDKENSSPSVKRLKQTERVAPASDGARFKGKIKTDKPDTFNCPVAYFEPDDPTKLIMYPKDKIYAVQGKEFQVEEMIAVLYETQKRPRKFESCRLSSSKKQTQSAKKNQENNMLIAGEGRSQDSHQIRDGGMAEKVDMIPVAYFEPDDPNKIAMYPKEKIYAVKGKEFQLEELKALMYERAENKSVHNSTTCSESSIKTPNQGTPQMQVSGEKVSHDSNSNLSLLNNQSLTVATKEAMNLVRGMWNSPSPVKKFGGKASSEKLEPEPFKVPPPPPKPGFALYTDEASFAGQIPSTSKDQDLPLKPTKPVIQCDIENIPFVPKTGSILRNKLKDKIAPVTHQDGEFENELGVRRLNSDEEDMNFVVNQKPLSVKKQPFVICSDEIETVESRVCFNKKEIGLLKTRTPLKTDIVEASCTTQTTTTTTSTRKSQFVIKCDDSINNQEIGSNLGNWVNRLVPAAEHDENRDLLVTNEDEVIKNAPLILPYVPGPVNDIPVLESERKENADPENYNVRKVERRELSGILQPSINLPVAPLQLQDKEYDFSNETCNTRAFAFALPSSTPFTSQFRNFAANSDACNDNTVSYCSFVAPEEQIPKQTIPTDLSIILEASKERYSSSSGSSSSGQTPYGPSRLKSVNTFSEIKGSELYQISEESIHDLEKSISNLCLGENIDPFCPELLMKLLSHIKFPQKHHATGCVFINQDAPVLRENCTLTLGKDKFVTEKELGKGAYARVLKATHKNKNVALKYQKPAFVWEYYIAREIRQRLSTQPIRAGFIEIDRAYVFNNASILQTEWGKFGSLLSVVNAVKLATGKPLKATIATLLSVQIFSIVDHLHRCKIIHGDIKPDNFILFALPSSDFSQLCVKLIDFGRSIDMTLLPEGTMFTKVVTTDGFQCNEMKDNRPWTYQTDYYGLAGTAYCLLMGDYMKVIKRSGKWGLQNMLPRYLHRDVWQPIFQDLLNIESCTSLPDLSQMQKNLEELLNSMGRLVFDHFNSLANIIQGH